MNKKVFKPDYKKRESRMSLASNEAVVMKRLISAFEGFVEVVPESRVGQPYHRTSIISPVPVLHQKQEAQGSCSC